ncbi:hypothetical protein RchiOBHm_Chr1g0365241 [Rosa chinensis]|uniref:Uncharacterized protein n=1 Tax=Rosa chinensis TaxID=74649 RepID=A0A2P6SJY3_ROSCH|nr:hypothetical protein RchiOBHm_Chr1g0365241 [Rosa chinensis]
MFLKKLLSFCNSSRKEILPQICCCLVSVTQRLVLMFSPSPFLLLPCLHGDVFPLPHVLSFVDR